MNDACVETYFPLYITLGTLSTLFSFVDPVERRSKEYIRASLAESSEDCWK